MKRILATILAFLYLSTSMGATIHLHYCMGKLISWGLLDHENTNCGYCGMSKTAGDKDDMSALHKNCCKDEHKEIKTDKDQKLSLAEYRFFKLFQDATAIQFLSLPSIRVSSITVDNPRANAPPLLNERQLFLLNRNFRI